MNRAVYLIALLGGCPPAPEPPPPATPLLRVGGSETMSRALLPALTAAHERLRGTHQFELSGGGTGAGIRQLLDGTLDVAAASRPHRPADEEQAQANGFSLEERGARHVIGMDVVAVVAHPDFPLDAVTYDQLIGIFCEQTIDDLKFLGDQLASLPLRPLSRDPRSGTRALFEDFFCGPRGIHRSIPEVEPDDLLRQLREQPGTIAFVSMTEAEGKMLALKADRNAPPVAPSQKTIANGRYPLYHDLYLYTAGPSSGDAKAFIDWVLSPAGQEVVDEHRFVPIYHRTEQLDGPRPLRETIHFEAGESYPNQRSIARIQLLVQELRERRSSGLHIILEGFTDDQEPNADELSRQRADAVRDLLAQQLDDPFFEIIPRGAQRPLAPNNTPYGRLRNRRVQIYLADEERARALTVVTPSDRTTPSSEEAPGPASP